MLSKRLRIASTSDIHLLHKRVPTSWIIDNLNRHLTCEAVMSDIDLLILAGDVFDGLAAFNSEDVPLVEAWVARVILLAKRFGVTVRILEGTRSHDRAQSEVFLTIKAIMEPQIGEVDLKWVRGVEVECIERWGLDILYVPDDWKHDTADTLVDAKKAIHDAGLTQVDIAIMHGQFRYQLPHQVKDHLCHNEEEYLALVRYLIFIGHVHTHRPKGRIIPHGSFDRLVHGEEEDKGYVRAELFPGEPYDWTCEFVVNEGAKVFKTIDCMHESVEDNIRHIDSRVADLPNLSYVRVRTTRTNAILQNLDAVKRRWPTYMWTDPKILDEAEDEPDIVPVQDTYVPINITAENIKQLVMERLEKYSLRSDTLQRCANHLELMQQL